MKTFKKPIILSLLLFVLFGCNLNNEDESKKSEEFPNIYDDNQGLIIEENVIILPEPTSLIQIKIDTLGEELPQEKEEGYLPVNLSLLIDGQVVETFGEIKVQGSSTAEWPKKNWRFRFYADEERSDELLLQIGNSVPTNKWIAKAEWIDPSLLRNALSFNLWEAVVQSRDEFPQYEVDYQWIHEDNIEKGTKTGAQGFPKNHPVQVKVNDEHYGLSMLLLGHEPRNFNIDSENPEHMYMEFDARGGEDSTKTWEKFTSDGIGTWIDGYHPENEDFSEEHFTAIDELSEFINGSQTDFEENFDKYFDQTNMIDMLLFLEVIYDWDAVAQDVEMVTYDLEKWYFLPWDKDTTFGMNWDQSGLISGSSTELLINYDAEDVTQKPWYKTYHAYTGEVEARYAQLRKEDIYSTKGLSQLISNITQKIPKEIWEAENERWEEEGRPSMDETSTAQIISWFEERLEMLDNQFNYHPSN